MIELSNRIICKKAIIAVIGLGYVGLPLISLFNKSGFKTIGIDIDDTKIKKLQSGKSYIKHIDFNYLKTIQNKGSIFTSRFSKIKQSDVIVLCLPTPLNKKNKPDTSFIINTLKQIKKYLHENQLISLESTTYPGCTRDLIVNKLKNKFLIGENFFVTYSPEREDPGNKEYNLNKIPKVLGGYSNKCQEIGMLFYKSFFKKIIPTKSLETAELTKLFENTFRSINISLVNELKIFTDKISVDINEVIKAASTKPFGFLPFYPGPGIGGHCIPIDPSYLSWIASKNQIDLKFIRTSLEVNRNTTKNIFIKIDKYFSKNFFLKKNILIIGVAYKKNIDDIRESPALKLFELFLKKNYLVDYFDPYIKKIPFNRNFNLNKKSITLNKTNISKFSVVVICTDHDVINYKLLYKHSNIIFDARNRYPYFDKKIIQI